MAGGSTLLDRVYVNTATVGTGSATLGAAKSNAFCTMSDAGGVTGTYTFIFEDGTDFEIVQGVWTSGTNVFTRVAVYLSKIAGVAGTTKISLSGSATMRLIAAKEDLTDASLFQSGTLLAARIAFAAKSDQVAASSLTLPVNPGVQQYHPSAAKAWVVTDTTGAIRASYNVTSVTNTGTGRKTVNYTTAFSSASAYAALVSSWTNTGGNGIIATVRSDVSQAAGTTEIFTLGTSTAATDPIYSALVAFGTQ